MPSFLSCQGLHYRWEVSLTSQSTSKRRKWTVGKLATWLSQMWWVLFITILKYRLNNQPNVNSSHFNIGKGAMGEWSQTLEQAATGIRKSESLINSTGFSVMEAQVWIAAGQRRLGSCVKEVFSTSLPHIFPMKLGFCPLTCVLVLWVP